MRISASPIFLLCYYQVSLIFRIMNTITDRGSNSMDLFTEVQLQRYLKPLESLKENALVNTVFSTGAWLIADLFRIFSTHLELAFLLMIAVIADFIFGVRNARRRGEYIRSFGFGQLIVKGIEYFIFLSIITGISNVFGTNDLGGWVGETLKLAHNIDWIAYFFFIFRELKSIAENISGEEGKFSKLVKMLDEKFFGKKPDDNWK